MVTLNQDLPLINNVLTGVDGSLEHSIAALQQSGTLLRNAKSDVDALLNDLNSVEKDERFAKLLDMVRENPDTVAEFLASPVELTTEHVYPVENYGSAMTPFYSILAIWVGGLLACSILKTNVKEDEKLRNIPPTVAYFGRYCLFAAVALLQGLIICLGDLFLLRIQCPVPRCVFIAVGLVAALVYSLMMYTLTVSFKDVGKAIAVVIMIVQVAGPGAPPRGAAARILPGHQPLHALHVLHQCHARVHRRYVRKQLYDISALRQRNLHSHFFADRHCAAPSGYLADEFL